MMFICTHLYLKETNHTVIKFAYFQQILKMSIDKQALTDYVSTFKRKVIILV